MSALDVPLLCMDCSLLMQGDMLRGEPGTLTVLGDP